MLTPEREKELLEEYHRRKAERETANNVLDQERLSRQTFFNNLQPKEVTVRKKYVCERCAEQIQPGEKAKIRSVLVGTGWPFSIITKYRHSEDCLKVKP
jgi:hypothetical protein